MTALAMFLHLLVCARGHSFGDVLIPIVQCARRAHLFVSGQPLSIIMSLLALELAAALVVSMLIIAAVLLFVLVVALCSR